MDTYDTDVITRTRFVGTATVAVALVSVLPTPATFAATVQVEPSIANARPSDPATTLTSRAVGRSKNEIAAYTLVVPRNISSSQLQARAIIAAGSTCPKLVTNIERRGQKIRVTRRMALRTPGATTNPAFTSLLACQAAIPKGATSATGLR